MLKKAFLLQNSSKALLLTYFLHLSQLYMLSPFSSSAEKNAAKQWCSVIVGPQNHLKEKHMPYNFFSSLRQNWVTEELCLDALPNSGKEQWIRGMGSVVISHQFRSHPLNI